MTPIIFSEIILVLFLLGVGNFFFEHAANTRPQMRTLKTIIGMAFHIPFLAGGSLFALATVIYISVLQRIPLSHLYPLMATNYIMIPLISLMMRKERPSPRMVAGLVLLLAGLVLVVTA